MFAVVPSIFPEMVIFAPVEDAPRVVRLTLAPVNTTLLPYVWVPEVWTYPPILIAPDVVTATEVSGVTKPISALKIVLPEPSLIERVCDPLTAELIVTFEFVVVMLVGPANVTAPV